MIVPFALNADVAVTGNMTPASPAGTVTVSGTTMPGLLARRRTIAPLGLGIEPMPTTADPVSPGRKWARPSAKVRGTTYWAGSGA